MSASPTIKELAERKADLKRQIAQVSQSPGVYTFYNEQEKLLYVGKAKNLRHRLSSYFSGKPASARVESMVNRVVRFDTQITDNEVEALVLEHNLIKAHNPHYNVLLRDDKSYPYILISKHKHPRVTVHRGAKKGGEFFGPYPSASSVRTVLEQVQKVIPVRQCEDSYYANRTRPCLKYQIKRCSAPCVGEISDGEYAEDVRQLRLLLEGKSNVLHEALSKRMNAASKELDFEVAADYRDRLQALGRLLHSQNMESGSMDCDIIASVQQGVDCAVSMLFVRGGAMVGKRQWFPQNLFEKSMGEVLFDFIAQIYARRPIPSEILVSHSIEERELLEEYLRTKAGRNVPVREKVRGNRKRLVENALTNAENALQTRRLQTASRKRRAHELGELLQLEQTPKRLECFDISHHGGSKTVASNVVFVDGMPFKGDYRRYNIEGITPGDDYAAMVQAIERRFAQKEDGTSALRDLPDVLIIDGGKGQLSVVEEALRTLSLEDKMTVLGVAKGPTRKAGFEELIVLGRGVVEKQEHLMAGLALVQHIRDEAHRFAITGHRARKTKEVRRSTLEDIVGLGAKRRRALLQYFGGLNELKAASVEEISRVDGISRTLAQRVYDYFK